MCVWGGGGGGVVVYLYEYINVVSRTIEQSLEN